MDLSTVTSTRPARTRSDLTLAAGETLLGGGTWLFSEPQPGTSGLVDLTTMGWAPLTEHAGGLRVAATCTIAQLSRLPARPGWAAHPLFFQCCTAFLASFKVWNVATVGGNICLSLPAGPMTSLAAALDADLLIWTADGGERRMPAAEFVTGDGQNALEPGEVLRAIEFPEAALRARTAYRQFSLSPVGRSGALLIGRLDPGGAFTLTVTASTPRPVRFRFDRIPTARELRVAVDGIDRWHDDVHGAPDWRRQTSLLMAEEIRAELEEAA